jgi:putative hydrolase of the HAD superfamily
VIRAVLFDLDDTLLDYTTGSDDCWIAACHATADRAGVEAERLCEAVDVARRDFWSDPVRHRRERVAMLAAWGKIAARALDALGCPDVELAAVMAEDFAARRRAGWCLYPDALPCLESLRARGVRLGMVTNGDAAMQREKLARFALTPWFEHILIEGEFGTGKPDPSVYRHVLDALGVAAGDAMMVGDNLEWDVVAPARLGVRGVWLDRSGKGGGGGADVTIRSLAELRLA